MSYLELTDEVLEKMAKLLDFVKKESEIESWTPEQEMEYIKKHTGYTEMQIGILMDYVIEFQIGDLIRVAEIGDGA